MSAYYNEHDKFAAQWLRNLIAAGHLPPGEVDERSIEDVSPGDLSGFQQSHFFAGIGIWPLALDRSGWARDRPVWTGSCPCQPFSAAGKGLGVADERHLWPAFHHLISVCAPDVVLGEQVASKDGLGWLEGLQADMEAAGYAVGAVDTCAAGFLSEQGSEGFHMRQRLYWGAKRLGVAPGVGRPRSGDQSEHSQLMQVGATSRLGHAEGQRRLGRADNGDAGRRERSPGQAGAINGVAHADGETGSGRGVQGQGQGQGPGAGSGTALKRPPGLRANSGASGGLGHPDGERTGRDSGASPGTEKGLSLRPVGDAHSPPGAVDWLWCRDGKYRPVESGTFPLAHEDPQRVGQLRAYGNALDAAQAQGFVEAWMECVP